MKTLIRESRRSIGVCPRNMQDPMGLPQEEDMPIDEENGKMRSQ